MEKIFQGFLAKIPNWAEQMINMEATRIKTVTPNSDIIDDLIKAVIQSNILLLTSTEIFEQVQQFAFELKKKGEKLSNVVFMGMVIHSYIHAFLFLVY